MYGFVNVESKNFEFHFGTTGSVFHPYGVYSAADDKSLLQFGISDTSVVALYADILNIQYIKGQPLVFAAHGFAGLPTIRNGGRGLYANGRKIIDKESKKTKEMSAAEYRKTFAGKDTPSSSGAAPPQVVDAQTSTLLSPDTCVVEKALASPWMDILYVN